jgi:hypothetical protein
MQRERRQKPQPRQHDNAAIARGVDSGVPSAATTRSRHVFIGRVWPLWVQNQTKYSPTTRPIHAAMQVVMGEAVALLSQRAEQIARDEHHAEQDHGFVEHRGEPAAH